MRSSRNLRRAHTMVFLRCNRLENAVKPQPLQTHYIFSRCCNRLENAVKPQQEFLRSWLGLSCNRLENAVKPQLGAPSTYRRRRCNRLENAVKPLANMFRFHLCCAVGCLLFSFKAWPASRGNVRKMKKASAETKPTTKKPV